MNARKASMFLYLIGKLKPAAWDAINPHGPKISIASREYMIAMAIKGFSTELENRTVGRKLSALQKALVDFASAHLAQDFGDDDWCGTPFSRPFPFPEPDTFPWFSFSDVMLNPQPLPPKARQKEIGGYLLLLSEATTLAEVANGLQAIGDNLISGK